MIRRGAVVLLIMILPGVCKVAPAQAPGEQGFEIVKNLDIYSNVIKELNTNYVDEIKPGELTKTAIDAMLESVSYTHLDVYKRQLECHRVLS